MNRIAFGDSYTYVQGTEGYANSTFIGSNLNFSYTPAQLLSDRIWQNFTSTAEGGPNWIEFLTKCGLHYGLSNPRQCQLQLWDFAFGGAEVSVEYTPLHHPWSVQLVNQTEEFLLYAEPVLKHIVDPTETLVAFWIGINDIGDSAEYNVSFPTFYNDIITTMFEQAVQPVYDAGYRKFMFINLPPLNRTPSNLVRAAGPLPNATMIEWWDETLKNHSTAFGTENPSTTSLYYDSNAFLNYILDNAASYNITNTTGYCTAYDIAGVNTDPAAFGCLPLHDYFWFNTGHM